METIIVESWKTVLAGGTTAIITILLGVIAYMIWERIQLFKSIKNYRKMIADNRDQYGNSLVELVDKYHESTLETVKVLTEIKTVISTLNKSIM